MIKSQQQGPKAPAPGPIAVPPWLSGLVRLLDDQFVVPGTRFRFGLDPVLGFLAPAVGDSVMALAACALLFSAWRQGAPTSLLFRMLANVALDAALGFVPLLGDLVDIQFKANRRNLNLLHAFSADRTRLVPGSSVNGGVQATRKGWLFLIGLLALVVVLIAAPFVCIAWLFTYLLHR
jgi:hypothetical protein